MFSYDKFSIPENRDITILTNVHTVKAVVFSSSYGQIWDLDHKNAERWRTYAFELWCWRRLLRVFWTARRPNQSILKEINPDCSLEELLLKLKLQYSGHLRRRADLLEKVLMLRKIEGKRRRGQQRMRWLDSIANSMDINLSKPQEIVNRKEWCAAVHEIVKSQTWLSNWTTVLNSYFSSH